MPSLYQRVPERERLFQVTQEGKFWDEEGSARKGKMPGGRRKRKTTSLGYLDRFVSVSLVPYPLPSVHMPPPFPPPGQGGEITGN